MDKEVAQGQGGRKGDKGGLRGRRLAAAFACALLLALAAGCWFWREASRGGDDGAQACAASSPPRPPGPLSALVAVPSLPPRPTPSPCAALQPTSPSGAATFQHAQSLHFLWCTGAAWAVRLGRPRRVTARRAAPFGFCPHQAEALKRTTL